MCTCFLRILQDFQIQKYRTVKGPLTCTQTKQSKQEYWSPLLVTPFLNWARMEHPTLTTVQNCSGIWTRIQTQGTGSSLNKNNLITSYFWVVTFRQET